MFSGLISAITGASNLGFTPDIESMSKKGSRCCMSEPIEGVTPEQLKEKFWIWAEKKAPFSSYVTSTNFTGEKSSGLVEEINFEITGMMSLLVKVKATFYAKYKIEGDTMLVQQFGPNKELKEVHSETRLTILQSPFRVEAVNEDFGVRKSGPVLKGLLQSDLKNLGYEGEPEHDVDSPSEPGKKSVVYKTATAVNFEEFWEKFKALKVSEGFEEAADGSLRKDAGGMFGGSNFSAFRCDKDKRCVLKEECGPDDSYKDVNSVMYIKMNEGSSGYANEGSIECWAVPKAFVDFSQTTADVVAKMLDAMIDVSS